MESMFSEDLKRVLHPDNKDVFNGKAHLKINRYIDLLKKFLNASAINPALTLGQYLNANKISLTKFKSKAPSPIITLSAQSHAKDVKPVLNHLNKKLHHRRAKTLQSKLTLLNDFILTDVKKVRDFDDYLGKKNVTKKDFFAGMPDSLKQPDIFSMNQGEIIPYIHSVNMENMNQFSSFLDTVPKGVSGKDVFKEWRKEPSLDDMYAGGMKRMPVGGATGGGGVVQKSGNWGIGSATKAPVQQSNQATTQLAPPPSIAPKVVPVIPVAEIPPLPEYPQSTQPSSGMPQCSSGGGGSSGGGCQMQQPQCQQPCQNIPQCNSGVSLANNIYAAYGDDDKITGTKNVSTLQTVLGISVNGVFDYDTLAAVKSAGYDSPLSYDDYNSIVAAKAGGGSDGWSADGKKKHHRHKTPNSADGIYYNSFGSWISDMLHPKHELAEKLEQSGNKQMEALGSKLDKMTFGDELKAGLEELNKFNPLMVLVRTAVLLSLDANLFGLTNDLGKVEGMKDQSHYGKIKNVWAVVGGNPDKLSGSIDKGKGKKKFMADGSYNACGCKTACKTCSTAATTTAVGAGTGAVAAGITAATGGAGAPAAAGAAGVITAITPIVVAAIKADGSKPSNTVPAGTPAGSGLDPKTAAALKELSGDSGSGITLTPKNKKALIGGAIAVAALILIFGIIGSSRSSSAN